MNELHEKQSTGIHLYTVYAQAHPLAEIEALVAKSSIKYPIAIEGQWGDVLVAASLPRVWIVGVDGKVVFAGDKGYSEVLEKELAKVKFPGLGKAEFAREAQPAATAFVEGKFANALKLAAAVIDGENPAAAVKDAEHIVKRIEERIRALTQRAETSEGLKDVAMAMTAWNELATRFAGCEDAADAPERLKKLKQDKDAQKELAARQALLVGMRDVQWAATDDDFDDAKVVKAFREKCIAFYEKFAKDNAGTAAATRASGLADAVRAAQKEADKLPEKKPEK